MAIKLSSLLDPIKKLISGFFEGLGGLMNLWNDLKEARRVDKKLKSIYCFLINDGWIERYNGILSNNTNEIKIPVLSRSWIRDKIYYTAKGGQAMAFLHDSYPRSIDFNIFKISKADEDKYKATPKDFYKLVDRDFSINAYTIGSSKLLENIIPTPRRTILLIGFSAFCLGFALAYFIIFYVLLG